MKSQLDYSEKIEDVVNFMLDDSFDDVFEEADDKVCWFDLE